MAACQRAQSFHPQRWFQIRCVIDLEETLRRYNEVRGKILARGEANKTNTKNVEVVESAEGGMKVKDETAGERAWKQLRESIEEA